MNFIQNDENIVSCFSRFLIGWKPIKSHWLKSWQFDNWTLNASLHELKFHPYVLLSMIKMSQTAREKLDSDRKKTVLSGRMNREKLWRIIQIGISECAYWPYQGGGHISRVFLHEKRMAVFAGTKMGSWLWGDRKVPCSSQMATTLPPRFPPRFTLSSSNNSVLVLINTIENEIAQCRQV